MSWFEGRNALVTGGSQGLGYAVVAEMARQGLGGAVIVGRNRDKGEAAASELSELGPTVTFVAANLGDPQGPPEIVETAANKLGDIHTLVNAAAKTDRDSIWEPDIDAFDDMFAVNVRAPFLLTAGVVANMRANDIEGSIVNVGSVAGYGGPDFIPSYSASKAALTTLTRNLANTLAPHRIRVNIVNPGWMNTPAEDHIQRKYHDGGDDWLERASEKKPFGRLIEPSEVARLIAFLGSPASGLMTGAVIDFDQLVWAGPLGHSQ